MIVTFILSMALLCVVLRKNVEEGESIFKAFEECARPRLELVRGNYDAFWHSFKNLTQECDYLDAFKALDIRPAANKDEIKYVAFPKRLEPLTMVTLGIGHDVDGEMKLKEMYPNTTFFGADPASVINEELYTNQLGGKYYQYAVSGETGMQKSRVYGEKVYEEEVTKHIKIDEFFKNVIYKDKIDILWMDIEGNEYSVMEQLHRDGALDRAGIKICQINVEMHKDVMKKKTEAEMIKFHDFVFKLLDDKKYIMLKPYYVKFKSYRFIRTFIVNVADKECTDLYIN